MASENCDELINMATQDAGSVSDRSNNGNGNNNGNGDDNGNVNEMFTPPSKGGDATKSSRKTKKGSKKVLTNGVATTGRVEQKKKKARVAKPIPSSLIRLTEGDLNLFVQEERINPKKKTEKVLVAVSVKVEGQEDDERCDENGFINFELMDLNLDQLRRLGFMVGCKGVQSSTKFEVCQAIAVKANSTDIYEESNVVQTAKDERQATSSGCRLVNAIFSPEIIPFVRTANDKKDRVDYETNNIEKMVWSRVTDMYSNTEPDDTLDILNKLINNNEGAAHLNEEPYTELNLQQFNPVTSKDVKAFVKCNMEGRRVIKQMMSESGHHCNDPFQYLDRAVNKIKKKNKPNKFVLYYYYLHCEDHPELDFKFTTSLPDAVKGSSDDASPLGDNLSESAKKASTVEIMRKTQEGMKTFQDEMIQLQKDRKMMAAQQILLTPGVLSPNRREKIIQQLLGEAGHADLAESNN